MEIEYEEDGSVKLHQEGYLRNLLKCHGMQDCNPLSTPLDTSVKLTKATNMEPLADSKEYASIVGGLMFVACVTQSDIMCAVGQLLQFLNKPTSRHLLTAKCILCYLKGTLNLGIRYGHLATPLVEFSDADWAGNLDTRRSTTGYVVMLNNGTVAWRSQRQPSVALSTMEAE